MKISPPRWADRFLEWYCHPELLEEIQGDAYELYDRAAKKSKRKADLLFIWNVVRFFRLRNIKKSTLSFSTPNPDMLRNYIKVAVRNLYQYKYFSLLNVFGLAIGMSVSLLLIALVSYVNTYDNFHVNKDNIYTIVSERTEGVEQLDYATAPVLLAEKLAENPAVQKVVRIRAGFSEEIKHAQGNLPMSGYYVEPNFLHVFTYTVTQGNASAALTKPNTIVLTESAAMRIFNSTDVLGKIVELEQGGLFEIGAVMKDHPINSHLKFEALVSYATIPEPAESTHDQWMHYDREYVYFLLREGGDIKRIQTELNRIAQNIYVDLPIKATFETQHLSDITMGPDYRQAIGPKWEMSGMIAFAVIAVLILLPACFNYTNISIARALKRAKEIGLRKTMGGLHYQIFSQFIIETVVISLFALSVGVLIFLLARSEFQSMLVAASSLDLSLTPKTFLWFVLFAMGTGLVAGIFPALYFGGLNPIQALKNKIHGRSSAMRIRKVLTVFQFALSFGFILALVVFSRQYHYSIGFNFGFNKTNVINIPLQDAQPERVLAEFSPLAAVQSVTFASDVLGLNYTTTWVKNQSNDSLEVSQVFVDHKYIPAFGLTLLAGNNFPDETWQRERFIIVNEEFLKAYQIAYPADAVGRTFEVEGNLLEVIGVVKNFHYAPLRFPIDKFFFRQHPNRYAFAHLNVQSPDPHLLVSQLENKWKDIGEQKFEARFFEDDLYESYSMYQTLLKIIGFLGLLAITISMLGMLGMVIFTSETRAKEVSIRKVMGATVYGLTFLLSKDYLKLMLLAILIGAPVTATVFSLVIPHIQYYSVTMSLWDVLLSTLLLVSMGLATIASQTIKTALTNPAETLRSE
ncbi:MAG TPA: ABC transporter permease [Cyclobacteriaceae bacterium]|nr:ABC transporter permease [Cyclobacteriaceae bacterium]HRJ82562.1 ABC transporter permease [Cyclobacteriaceae bacterium]